MSDTWQQIREFFARLFSRGKHGVETVAESLDRQAKIQRLAGQVRALARERNSLVITIGKKVYALHTRGKVKNRDVLADCKRIDQIRDEIAEFKRQIEEIRLASMGEMPMVDLEDESLLGEEEPAAEAAAQPGVGEKTEEIAPAPAEEPAAQEAPEPEPPPEVEEAKSKQGEGAVEPTDM
jgi:seryl-tRNA synthetase